MSKGQAIDKIEKVLLSMENGKTRVVYESVVTRYTSNRFEIGTVNGSNVISLAQSCQRIADLYWDKNDYYIRKVAGF